ncbi:MAG: acetate/propionate family kinase [Chloroflexi bacterium]|nr:acetate/propionate family kinase [Chloroflexota bacterium]MBV9898376.1 acetate/propionate family kinase [Chloroflexota bacterium]
MNMGSSSLKWVVLDSVDETVQQQGDAHWQGAIAGHHADELAAALERVGSVDAVGHRVVHGGLTFQDPVLIDERVRQEIDRLSEIAPLHNPAALAGIDAARQRFPNVPQVATFDTAFHRDLPQAAAVYPIPWDWTSRWQLRRFGFHGLSVEYAVGRAREVLGQLPHRLVVCHLGAGCSITAVEDGRSINTSMGFTPLEGTMMVQRSGSVDPGMLVYLLTRQGLSPTELDRALNEQSGVLGVSGISAEVHEVLTAAARGDARAVLARDMFVHRLVFSVGGMLATLGGIDALVFTGGIGEHSAEIRSLASQQLEFVGLRLDAARNANASQDADVAADDSQVRVPVITAREDLTILRHVRQVLQW